MRALIVPLLAITLTLTLFYSSAMIEHALPSSCEGGLN